MTSMIQTAVKLKVTLRLRKMDQPNASMTYCLKRT